MMIRPLGPPPKPEDYDGWYEDLSEDHKVKEQWRRWRMEQAQLGQEIPFQFFFFQDSVPGRWHFSFDCPCCLWPDGRGDSVGVVTDSELTGIFGCPVCKRRWIIMSWDYSPGLEETNVQAPRRVMCILKDALTRSAFLRWTM